MTEPSSASKVVETDVAHRSSRAIDGDVVADLDAACHERDTIEEILEDILHGEADTGRETCRDRYDPRIVDVEDGEGNENPRTPNHHLDKVTPDCRMAFHILQDHLPFLCLGFPLLALHELVVEGMERDMVDIFGKEEEHGRLHSLHDAECEFRRVDQWAVEELKRGVAEVEHVGSPVDADQNG